MTALDLLEAIGEIDERDVALAHAKRSNKPLYIAIGSVAACLVVLLMLPGIVMNLIGFGGAMDGDVPPADMAPDGDDAVGGEMGDAVTLDVVGKDTAYAIQDRDTVAEITSLLAFVTENADGTPSDVVPPLSVPEQGEYRLILTDRYGYTAEYLLRANYLISYEVRLEYVLNAEQTVTLYRLLGLQ